MCTDTDTLNANLELAAAVGRHCQSRTGRTSLRTKRDDNRLSLLPIHAGTDIHVHCLPAGTDRSASCSRLAAGIGLRGNLGNYPSVVFTCQTHHRNKSE